MSERDKTLGLDVWAYRQQAEDLKKASDRASEIDRAYNNLASWPRVESFEVKMSVPASSAGPVIAQWLLANWHKLRPQIMADLESEAEVLKAMFPTPNRADAQGD